MRNRIDQRIAMGSVERPQTFDYSYAAGAELLTQSGVQHGQKITLKPWDVAIVEEK